MENIFLTVLNMSITSAIVVCAVCFVRILLRKAPRSISYALWAAVLFRAVCPVSFSFVFSFFGGINSIGAASSDGSINFFSHAAAPVTEVTGETVLNAAHSGSTPAIGSLQSSVPAANFSIINVLLSAGTVLWIVGVIIMITCSVISYIKLRKKISTATLVSSNVYESDRIDAPFVCGLIRPRIYLPVSLSNENRRYVLAHEQTHIRRRDYLVKPFAFLVLSVHWFNPLMWAAYLLMSKDIEMSCDERVIRTLGAEVKTEYSTALLTLATGRSAISGTPLAFGESGIRSRVKNILSYKRRAFWIIAVAIAVCVIVYFCFLSNPVASITDGNTVMPITTAAESATAPPSPPAPSVTETAKPQDIVFNDEGLETDVREYLGIYGRPVTTEDVSRVQSMMPIEKNVKNISALKYFTSLSYLDLSDNQVSDISALAGLKNLNELNLSGNQVSDITPLASLTNLTNLNLNSNPISDISALSGLTNLNWLVMYAEDISDLSPLAGLTNLTELCVSGKFTDISALASLTNLTGLGFESKQLSDISALASLKKLEHLSFSFTQISDISPLAGLTKLKGLQIYRNNIGDISPLSGLNNLTLLHMQYNQISDISILGKLTKLENLSLSYNKIRDISPLTVLTNLSTLHLDNNNISDISALAEMKNIRNLYLAGNSIEDYAPIEDYYGQLETKDFSIDVQ